MHEQILMTSEPVVPPLFFIYEKTVGDKFGEGLLLAWDDFIEYKLTSVIADSRYILKLIEIFIILNF